MSLNKFINVPPEKPFHSNQYAEDARGGQIGSMNNQTFSQRTQVEKSRKAIRQYRESLVARGAQHHHAHHGPIDIVRPTANRNTLRVGQRQASNARPQSPQLQKPVSRQSFSEPTHRGYNPYG